MTAATALYYANTEWFSQQVTELVAEAYTLKAESPVDAVVTCYDTFDWRLFNSSLVLCQAGDELTLRRLPTGVALQTLAGAPPPTFARQLGDGPLKRRIASVAGDRRLFQVGAASVRTLPYRVLNADDKTVAHEKRRARLNLIAHLLSQVPYEEVLREPVKFPKRQGKGDYVEPDYPYRMVPAVY